MLCPISHLEKDTTFYLSHCLHEKILPGKGIREKISNYPSLKGLCAPKLTQEFPHSQVISPNSAVSATGLSFLRQLWTFPCFSASYFKEAQTDSIHGSLQILLPMFNSSLLKALAAFYN